MPTLRSCFISRLLHSHLWLLRVNWFDGTRICTCRMQHNISGSSIIQQRPSQPRPLDPRMIAYLLPILAPTLTKHSQLTDCSPPPPLDPQRFNPHAKRNYNSSNQPYQPHRPQYRTQNNPPPRPRNHSILHPPRKTPSQKPQRVQPMETKNPSDPEFHRRLDEPRQRTERRRERFCGDAVEVGES
jgi:hypothetical protein